MGMRSEAVCEIGKKKGKSEREIYVGNEIKSQNFSGTERGKI